MKKYLLLLIFPLFFINSNAQSEIKGKYKRISLDVYGGLPIFYGDVKNDFVGYNVTSRLNWNLTSAFSFGGEFSYGQFKGQDDGTESEYFRTKYMKAMMGSEIYFFNALNFNEITNWFQPFIGLSIGALKSDVEDSGNNLAVNAVHFNDWAFAHQWVAGMKFKLSKSFDLNARYGITFVKSDKLDNFEPNVFNNTANDILTNVELGLTFHIGGKGKNPVIWKPSNNNSSDLAKKKDQDNLKEEQDSLRAELDKVVEDLAVANTTNEGQDAENASLKERLDDLQAQVVDLGNKQNNNTVAADGFFGADEHIYEAALTGSIQADYYIVVGSYVIPSNADYRMKEVTDKGYSPFIMKETKADLNRVVVDYTDDYKVAIEKVSKYRQELDPSAWIIKRRK